MLMHFGVTLTFRRAGAAKRDASRDLSFEQLPMTDLVGARQDASRCCANRRTIVVETDARNQTANILFRKACIGAGGAGLHAAKAGVDAAAHHLGMAGLFGMRAEHVSNDSRGHFQGFLPNVARTPTATFTVEVGSAE